MFTPAEKLKCIQREVALRRSVYPRLVQRGRMKQAEADRELALMESIAADYLKVVVAAELGESNDATK